MAGILTTILVLCGTIQSHGFKHPVPESGASPPQPPVSYYSGLPCAHPPVCRKTWYRSLDGSCNNLGRPKWGMAFTPYGRLLPYKYADGISAWPVSTTGAQLPNARAISLILFSDKKLYDPTWTLITQQWGQIITHDMSLTAGITTTACDRPVCSKKTVTCCQNGKLTPDAATNPVCRPIKVSPLDPWHAPFGTKCLDFVRASTTRDRGCTPLSETAKQLSAVTSYMDMSLVYGTSEDQAAGLREYNGGRLQTVQRGGQMWPQQEVNVSNTCIFAQSPKELCYKSGDIRSNQNPQLTILVIVLIREHNRIADALTHLNPHWNDETTFQEARRINIAQYQHINYYEYLPILLGYENMVKKKLIYPGVNGYVNDYDPTVDPSVLDEHSTAALRHFHTLIRGQLQMKSENRQQVGTLRLSDWFFRPMVIENGTSFEDLVRGLTTQEMGLSDQFFTNEVTQYLFRNTSMIGDDLRALDIQRGRDHGLSNYVSTRKACGLHVPKSFSEMTDFISSENVLALSRIYKKLEDVELTVGGSVERNVPGALIGPTFLCILLKQFHRTRVADRFFYENGADPKTAFTLDQLDAIRSGASMARLLCDNVKGVHSMQPKAFELIKKGNQVVPCDQLPAVDLSFWMEAADVTS